VEEGDRMKAGQIIAQLDDSKFKSAYDAALASHHQAEDAFNRLKKVYENGSLPEVDWQDIKTKKAQSKAALELSEQNLKDCKLLAPSSGIIGSIDIETGMNASPNLPVFDLLNMDVMYAKISVPENEINKIEKGQSASIIIGALGNSKFEAVVEKMGVTANPVSRTYEVKIRLISQPENIKPGMLCDVQIFPEHHAQVFSLPINAILKDENHKNYIYTLNESNKIVSLQYVKVGQFYNNRVEIVSGLKTNDRVIISGQHKLSPNAKVNI
jgi:RND family efflux transporter MFP subunit